MTTLRECTPYWFEVDSVLSDNEVLIREQFATTRYYQPLGRTPIKFIVEMPAKGHADDTPIQLKGVMEVVDTKKVKEKTYFVLRPVPDK